MRAFTLAALSACAAALVVSPPSTNPLGGKAALPDGHYRLDERSAESSGLTLPTVPAAVQRPKTNRYGSNFHCVLLMSSPLQFDTNLGPRSTAAVGIDDPFIWHYGDMVSTWVFFGYSRSMDYNAAAMALRRASSEANSHPPDDLIGSGLRSWIGVYRDAQPVEMVLVARAGMTWNMLAEGTTGAQMVVFGGKEYQFAVMVRGEAEPLGYGHIRRRYSASGENALVGTSGGANATLRSDLAEGLVRAKAYASRFHVYVLGSSIVTPR